MIRVVVEQGEPHGAVFVLEEGQHVVGRGHRCSVRLTAPDVSREHCLITIAGTVVRVENLSKFKTRLDDQPFGGVTEARHGQRLGLGKSTVLRLDMLGETVLSLVSKPGQSPVSGEEPAGSSMSYGALTTRGVSAAGTQATVPTAGGGTTVGRSQETLLVGADGKAEDTGPAIQAEAVADAYVTPPAEGSTRVQRTRPVPPEVVEEVRRELVRQQKRRTLLIGAGLVALLPAAGLVIHLTSRNNNVPITWPTDAQGQTQDGYISWPERGRAHGYYDLLYPVTGRVDTNISEDTITVSCLLNPPYNNIPLRLTLREDSDAAFVTRDLDACVDLWIEKSEAEGLWGFQRGANKALFFGERLRENGLPFRLVTYQLQDNRGKWFGVAYVFQYGRTVAVLRAEVPVEYLGRCEDILYTAMIEPAPEFVRGYWGGGPLAPPDTVASQLARIRAELRRKAAGTWDEIQETLFGCLRRAVLDGDRTAEQDARELLVQLRSYQAMWFHRQDLDRLAAIRIGDQQRVRQIARQTQAVFSSPDDWRYYECRKW